MTKFTHVKTYARGAKRENGKGMLCLHCGSTAESTSFSKSTVTARRL